MVLEEHRIAVENIYFQSALEELLHHQSVYADPGCLWGYFPNISEDINYPRCQKLHERLTDSFVKNLECSIEREVCLSFIKASISAVTADVGGLHIDVDADIGIVRPPNRGPNDEVLRILMNAHSRPREIQYTSETKNQLRSLGVTIDEDRYTIIQLNSAAELRAVEIPPKRDNSIYVLKFWASLLPHAAITSDEGAFVIGFGSFVNRRETGYNFKL